MIVQKSAQDAYQLFAGILDKKLFLQIINRDGTLKYGFESTELDTSNEKTLCEGIMNACYDFFDPSTFNFDEDFVLNRDPVFTLRRYGEKAMIGENTVLKCQSFENLPAISSWLFMESFLPFEQPMKKATYCSIPGEVPIFIGYR